MYLKGDGTVWAAWVIMLHGRLGDGTTNRTGDQPVQVVDGSGNPLSGVVGISAGSTSHGVFEGGRHGLGGRGK